MALKVLPKLTDAKTSKAGFLNKEDLVKMGINVLKFTAPATAALFFALSKGVKFEEAWPVALFILYALVADYLSKLNSNK